MHAHVHVCVCVWEAGFGSEDLPPTQVGVVEAPELRSALPTDTNVCKYSPTGLNLDRLMKRQKKTCYVIPDELWARCPTQPNNCW